MGIKSWPKNERPREKLFREGEHKLTNTELLAILLRSGVKDCSAVELSRKMLQRFKNFREMSNLDLSYRKYFKGLGAAKIAQIRAAIEISKRLNEDEIVECPSIIKSSEDAVSLFLPRMRDLKKEVFKVLFLDSRNKVIDVMDAIEGTVNHVNPIVREIYHKALQNFSVYIICGHNHPSGDLCPSNDDKDFTQRLAKAGDTLGIKLLDHIIVGKGGYFSFLDEGLIGMG